LFLLSKLPPFPEKDAKMRADHPLGQFMKHIVHRIASVCVRDREEEADEHWRSQAGSYEIEMRDREQAAEIIETMSPKSREQLAEAAMNMMEEFERAEPGEDWLEMDEIVASDEAFEKNRARILREDAQELTLYLMIFERRIKTNGAYSGLEMINDQDVISYPHEQPDWEPDKDRDKLIKKLEALTGQSLRD
jgi:hypothetical protein